MTMATVRCAQPGCDGMIQDGYCDTCGLAAPAASSGPSGLSGSVSAGSGSAGSGSAGSAMSANSSVWSPSARSRARVRGSSRSARGRLGAGLVDIPPVPYRDPASAVLADPRVPEAKRYCSNCDQPVGRGRDGRPGTSGQPVGGGPILGCEPNPRAVRFGLERSYRALARLAPDDARRIELVDMANAIRPRTPT